MTIRSLLDERVSNAMRDAGYASEFPPRVAISKKPEFGDYQANGAMAVGKSIGKNPREVAQTIVENLDLEGIAAKIEIAGPGFINIHLDQQWLAKKFSATCEDDRLGIEKKGAAIVVVDYSGPNLAKEMHVGHLRSTIIGDAVTRTLEFLGHKVIRQNHVGDWGTQFGMLLAELEDQMTQGEQADLALSDLESFYQQAKKRFDADAEFSNRAREYVVKLQSGDKKIHALWQNFRDVSLSHAREIYQLLNVSLTDEDVRGESFYNDDLPILVGELKENKLAEEDQGAQVVFLPELADKDGEPKAVLIQKQDGGYLYMTTDLAGVRYRANQLHADRILYFIDDRQSDHMKQVFTLSRKAKFVDEWIELEHCAFGKMLGKDGKPFKTRTGGTVKLAEVINEAIAKAELVVREKNPDLDDVDTKANAIKVGVGAVKYADLCKTRTNDYVFNLETMLSLEGNTGPYLQYAYARIMSVFRKAGLDHKIFKHEVSIEQAIEKDLVLKTLQFSDVIDLVVEDALPHILCNYLFDLANLFSTFYEACPILKSGVDESVKNSRLQIIKGVAHTLDLGLDLLGIETMDKM